MSDLRASADAVSFIYTFVSQQLPTDSVIGRSNGVVLGLWFFSSQIGFFSLINATPKSARAAFSIQVNVSTGKLIALPSSVHLSRAAVYSLLIVTDFYRFPNRKTTET